MSEAPLLLIVHALLGFMALASAFLVLAYDKGNKKHTMLGNIFVAFTIAALFAGSMYAMRVDVLYFINIGIATLLQIVIGLRVLTNKEVKLHKVEILLLSIFMVNALMFFIYNTSVTMFLGGMYTLIGLLYLHTFSRFTEKTKNLWLAVHISSMLGAVISVISAFIVGNLGMFAGLGWLWVLPAALSIWVVRYFRLKYAPQRKKKIWRFTW